MPSVEISVNIIVSTPTEATRRASSRAVNSVSSTHPLNLTKDAVRAVAEEAMALKTGARALRSIMERLMLDIMYEIPNLDEIQEVAITRAVVEGKRQPKLRKMVKKAGKDAA